MNWDQNKAHIAAQAIGKIVANLAKDDTPRYLPGLNRILEKLREAQRDLDTLANGPGGKNE